jgi:hypothetical protein
LGVFKASDVSISRLRMRRFPPLPPQLLRRRPSEHASSVMLCAARSALARRRGVTDAAMKQHEES